MVNIMTLSVLDTLESILDGIVSLIKMLGTFLMNFGEYTTILTDVANNIPNYITWLPVSVGGVIVTIVAIGIIAKILGRDG